MPTKRGRKPVVMDVAGVKSFLARSKGLEHLRVRHHANVVTIESGPTADPFPHARLRQVGAQLWQLEMPTHTGRWEPTPMSGPRDDVLEVLVADFGWTLEPVA